MTRTERNFALVEIELRLRTWRLAKLSLIFFKAVAKLLQRICIILFIVFFFFFFIQKYYRFRIAFNVYVDSR